MLPDIPYPYYIWLNGPYKMTANQWKSTKIQESEQQNILKDTFIKVKGQSPQVSTRNLIWKWIRYWYNVNWTTVNCKHQISWFNNILVKLIPFRSFSDLLEASQATNDISPNEWLILAFKFQISVSMDSLKSRISWTAI